MGGKISMKKIILFSIFSVLLCDAAGINKALYDDRFNTLSKPRMGLANDKISALRDPFYPLKPKQKDGEIQVATDKSFDFQLRGIMGNKVKLNESWYYIGDYIGPYQIVKINENSVLVADGDNKVEIKMNQGKKNVIITYK